MNRTVEVIYEGGVFRPLEPVDLPDRTRMTIPLSGPPSDEDTDAEEERPWRGVMNVEWPERVIARKDVDLRDVPRAEPEANFSWFPPPEDEDDDSA